MSTHAWNRRTFLHAAVGGALVSMAGKMANAAEEVKLGVVLPLTGSLASFGQASLHGIELAVKHINESDGLACLGGSQLKLVIADAQSDPTTAASVTTRLLSQDDVKAIVGAYASSLTVAVNQITERRGIPLLTMSTSDQLTTSGYEYIFQDVPRASVIGQDQLRYTLEIAKDLNKAVNNIAIVYENTDYGTSTAKGLKGLAEKLGVHVSLYASYPPGLTDATSLIQKIKAATPKPDVIFPASYFTDAVLIIRGLRQAGIKTPVVGGAAGYVIPAFWKSLGEAANGVLTINYSNYDHYGEFGEEYRKQHGEFMTHEAFENLVLTYAYVAAVCKAQTTDPGKVAAALRSLTLTDYPFSGLPGGGVRFNKDGVNDMTYPLMVQWRDGELVSIWPKADALGKPQWD